MRVPLDRQRVLALEERAIELRLGAESPLRDGLEPGEVVGRVGAAAQKGILAHLRPSIVEPAIAES